MPHRTQRGWSPRENLPGQVDLIPILDALVVEAEAARSNGGPPLDETRYEVLARIGRAMYGDLWHAKLAEDIGENPRVVRRWRAGKAVPSSRAVAFARDAGRQHAERIMREIGR